MRTAPTCKKCASQHWLFQSCKPQTVEPIKPAPAPAPVARVETKKSAIRYPSLQTQYGFEGRVPYGKRSLRYKSEWHSPERTSDSQ